MPTASKQKPIEREKEGKNGNKKTFRSKRIKTSTNGIINNNKHWCILFNYYLCSMHMVREFMSCELPKASNIIMNDM